MMVGKANQNTFAIAVRSAPSSYAYVEQFVHIAGQGNDVPSTGGNLTATIWAELSATIGEQNFRLHLIAGPQNNREDWKILSDYLFLLPYVGFLLLLDSTNPETFTDFSTELSLFRAYKPLPTVIVAINSNHPDAWSIPDLYTAFHMSPDNPDMPILTCDPQNVESVHTMIGYLVTGVIDG